MRFMRQMNSMMSNVFPDPMMGGLGGGGGMHSITGDPFGGGLLGGPPPNALTNGHGAAMQMPGAMQMFQHHHHMQPPHAFMQSPQQPHYQQQQQHHHHHPQSHQSPFAMVAFDMPNLLSSVAGGGHHGGGASFSSSQVVTMTRGPDGRPQVYKATSSTKVGPGGVRETQKTVQDSRSGVRKMAIGHHIGERSHVVERERNYRTGDEEERQEFVNLEETEADEFNREFEQRTRHLAGVNGASGSFHGGGGGGGGRDVAAIMPAPSAAGAPLAIMSAPSAR